MKKDNAPESRRARAEGALSSDLQAIGEAETGEQGPVARGLDVRAGRDPATDDTETQPTATTMGVQPSVVPGPIVTNFPIAGWDRYQCIRFLGQGGMGQVFLARDLRLHREVAIKFVRGDNPHHVSRLISEARAQARVDHERVCKVYEVGEVQGKVYIAMQYVDGKSLGAMGGELTIEETTIVLRAAAEGVHEAHRAGLIHRDIKPANIMVERSQDGDLKPYVVDFGLARDWKNEVTETGMVLGTPHYMSPEQARGEVKRLDRRADVYSLGATLYHLLVGEPPIPGNNPLKVLNSIHSFEPRPPRERNPDIPVDLEAITLKCLEKDRSARYDSARALAEDLGRFLSGDPILARPAGFGYRLRKRLLKHRGMVALGTMALLLLLFALGWGIAARRAVALRERLARRFTERVERIEALARYSALARLHDIRADRNEIRTRLTEFEAEIQAAGEVAVGPGHYALGRGFLALGEEGKALEYLTSAWQRGFREPRAAYALALAMGRRYQELLLDAEKIRSPEPRQARKREIEHRYRDPALGYLRQSAGADGAAVEYVAALIAFYEDHLEEALRLLEMIEGRRSWFYEASELRGDIYLARASRRWNQGDREGALADFAAGRRAYTVASDMAESAPAVHEALGELEYAAMLMELYGQGDVMPLFEHATRAVSRALTADPEHYATLVLEARLHRRLAEYRTNQGGPAEELLGKAIAAAERALSLAPTRPKARLELGRCYWQWGSYRQARGQDPREQLQKAVRIYEGIAPAARDYEFHTQRGLVFDVWADYDDQVGANPLDHRQQAIASFVTATQLDDHLPDAWLDLGMEYFARGSYSLDADVDGDLRQAGVAYGKARSLNPQHIASYFGEAKVHQLMAKRLRARGRDALPELAMAIELYQKGLAINPKHPLLHNGLGAALIEQAREAWDRGGDPEPLLRQARAAFDQAIAVAPEQDHAYLNIGEVLAQRIFYHRARDQDPAPLVSEAVTVLRKAIERLPNYSLPWANLGMVHAIQASFEIDHGRDPQHSLTAAQAALAGALQRNPNDAQAHLYLGEARGIRARWQARNGAGRSQAFEEAAQSFEKAVFLAPENLDARILFGRFCRAWASGQSAAGQAPTPLLKRCLQGALQVLDQRATPSIP